MVVNLGFQEKGKLVSAENFENNKAEGAYDISMNCVAFYFIIYFIKQIKFDQFIKKLNEFKYSKS